jgi:low affinity Fe/Cu permease
VFGNLSASVTVIMVFVLQHTQRREQLALQLEVDELLHASPATEERLVAVEEASDDEMLDFDEQRLSATEQCATGRGIASGEARAFEQGEAGYAHLDS